MPAFVLIQIVGSHSREGVAYDAYCYHFQHDRRRQTFSSLLIILCLAMFSTPAGYECASFSNLSCLRGSEPPPLLETASCTLLANHSCFSLHASWRVQQSVASLLWELREVGPCEYMNKAMRGSFVTNAERAVGWQSRTFIRLVDSFAHLRKSILNVQ